MGEGREGDRVTEDAAERCNGQELSAGGPARPPRRRPEGMRPATPASKGRAGPDGAGRAGAAGPAMGVP